MTLFPNDMHELSITQSILSIVLEQAKTAKASKISEIDLTIGELSGVVDESVQFCFDFNTTAFNQAVTGLNPRVKIFPVSCKTGEGLEAWFS